MRSQTSWTRLSDWADVNIAAFTFLWFSVLLKSESTNNAGDPSWIPGLGRSAGEGKDYPLSYSWASLVAQLVKNPPAMQETSVQSLGWEKCPGEGKGYPLRYSGLENSKGSQRVGYDWATFTFAKIFLYVPLVSTLLFYFSWIYFKQHRGKICKYSEAACFFY